MQCMTGLIKQYFSLAQGSRQHHRSPSRALEPSVQDFCMSRFFRNRPPAAHLLQHFRRHHILFHHNTGVSFIPFSLYLWGPPSWASLVWSTVGCGQFRRMVPRGVGGGVQVLSLRRV